MGLGVGWGRGVRRGVTGGKLVLHLGARLAQPVHRRLAQLDAHLGEGELTFCAKDSHRWMGCHRFCAKKRAAAAGSLSEGNSWLLRHRRGRGNPPPDSGGNVRPLLLTRRDNWMTLVCSKQEGKGAGRAQEWCRKGAGKDVPTRTPRHRLAGGGVGGRRGRVAPRARHRGTARCSAVATPRWPARVHQQRERVMPTQRALLRRWRRLRRGGGGGWRCGAV